MQPAISLIITAYNREKYIGAAIESVLAQTRVDFELLIWDDGSTDRTVEIARGYEKRDDRRIKVIAAKHQGLGLSLKQAIAQTNAPYLGWLDSDDLLAPTALAETSQILDSQSDIGWVYTDYLDIDAEDNILSYGYRCLVPYNPQKLLDKFMTFHFRLIRREVFDFTDGIDIDSEVPDYDLCMRLSEVAKVQHIFKPLYYYRTHPDSISWQRQYRQIKDSCKAIVKAQKRRKSWQKWIASSILPMWLGLFTQPASAQITPANDGTGTTINNQGNNINITGGSVSSNNANLFHSFSQFGLDANQTANFLSQPNIQNILGRVTGGNASIINGLIQVTGSNANLYLINPAGIIFGANSSLNVPASFTATTANGIQFGNNQWLSAIGTNDYNNLVGSPTGFGFINNQNGSIFNSGNLAVNPGESFTLLGGTVINTGTITAAGGNIKIMAVSGDKIVRITPENSLLSVDLTVNDKNQINSESQQISPLSLPQLLTGGNIPSATGVTVENGEIKLTSANTVVPSNSGTNIVNGNVSVASTGNGGNIQILGDSASADLSVRIALFKTQISANGINGGTILIGGDYQGQGTIPTANNTYTSHDSIISANGINGNGGKVVVWADDTTRFFGKITATGINGGLVETSGKNFLDVNGAIVNAGTWLLDPTDVEIVTGGIGTLTGGIFDPATNTNIAPSTILSALDANTNVIITTASGTGGNGDITLTNSITQTGLGTGSLTLTGRRFNRNPYGSITINGALTFNINQINPETITTNPSIQNSINSIGSVGSATINLGAGTYREGTIYITKNITLNGASSNSTFIDGQLANCVFAISATGIVNINDLAIINGKASGIVGGGIDNQNPNNININNVIFRNNSVSAISGRGGAIFNNSGVINISNSTFNGNSAFQGGGIYNNAGTVNITRTTLNNNTSSDGGAIFNANNISSLVISNSTFNANTASINGGAIYNLSGSANIFYSTLSGNTANGQGGGIYNLSSSLELKNTIVASNTNASSPDISGTVSGVSSYNLIGIDTGMSGISNGINGNQIGTAATPINPQLAPLGDYGGTTQTMALLPDSPAINNAVVDNDFTTDQRDTSRGTTPDIGAFELQGYTITPVAGSGQNTTVATDFASPLQAQITENGFAKPVPGISVSFGVPGTGASATFTAIPTGITDVFGNVSSPTITANTIAGTYAITATSGNLTPVSFALTNNPDVPATITAIGGTPQATIVNTSFASQLEAIVADKFGNPVPNTGVIFNAPLLGASAIFASSPNIDTDSAGKVSIGIVANTIAGAYTITANSGRLIPANFNLINNPDIPVSIIPIGGTPQATVVNTVFASQLEAMVVDQFGNSVPNAGVTFNAPLLGASSNFLAIPSLITDGAGKVSIGVVANTISGNYNVTANSGTASPASFSLTNNPDVPIIITPIGGTPQATIINTSFGNQLQAVVQDQFGNPVPNISVTFNAPGTGASASFAGDTTVISNGNGIVSIPVKANTIAGNYNVNASSGGLIPANFTLVNTQDDTANPEVLKPKKPPIPPNNGNVIVLKNDPVEQIDQEFTNDFTEYLSIPDVLEITSVNESQEILQKINSATGVKPGLIYVSFVPETVTDGEARILKSASDRLEIIIVTQSGKPFRKVINVTKTEILEVAQKFRNGVTDPRLLKSYLKPSEQLYNWLIKPLEAELKEQKIDNLVFIMDAGLRTLPIAALYDGKQYLIEKYSVGLMPSLSLSDTSYVDIRKAKVLGMGVSKFSDRRQVDLPGVPTELSAITNQLWIGKSFLNEGVTLKNLQGQRQEIPYGIIHLATHGEFQSGEPSKSYIQLWDTRLQMNQLRQLGWNNPPVELVVLSACRTALGDKEAELGFAGFAVQAGAKSALASLWYVSDEGTLGLMSEFYKQLRTSPIKSEALRQAQLSMLKGEVRLENGQLLISRGNISLPPLLRGLGNKELQHPYFWSGFTMIGNPW